MGLELSGKAGMLKQRVLAQQQGKNEAQDYFALASVRERRMRMRMLSRLSELDGAPMDLPNDARRRAVIEAKEIKLAELQKQVRGRVATEMHRMLMSRERVNDLMPLIAG